MKLGRGVEIQHNADIPAMSGLGSRAARKMGIYVIGLTGQTGGGLKDTADLTLMVPSTDTPRIQEAHITIAHIICQLVESELFH
jgi:D-sedoheptulose 7-phosphate isomerase